MVQSRHKPTREVSLYSGAKVISDGLSAGCSERMRPTFGLAVDAFIRAIEGENLDYPNLVDGLRAQMIAEAAVESLKTNRPVKITYWQPE